MPTYDYRCPSCGTFEFKQSIKDTPLEYCPTCESTVERLISSGVGIIFKGSGFYINDNRSNAEESKDETPSSDKAS